MKRDIFIMARVSSLVLFIASTVAAPCAFALSVSPPHTEVSLPPGGVTTAIISVMNPHAEVYDVELSEKPWFIYPDNRKIAVADWLILPGKKHFRLKPGKSRDVKITIRCPKDAVGELMGMVSVAYQGMQASMITPMISTAVYLEVKGTERYAGEVLSLAAGMQNGRFQVSAQIKATGNIRLRPAGTIRLLNDQSQAISLYTVPESSPLFPGTLKDFSANGPDKALPAGRYTLSADLRSGTLELLANQEFVVKANGDIELVKKEAPKS